MSHFHYNFILYAWRRPMTLPVKITYVYLYVNAHKALMSYILFDSSFAYTYSCTRNKTRKKKIKTTTTTLKILSVATASNSGCSIFCIQHICFDIFYLSVLFPVSKMQRIITLRIIFELSTLC